MTKYLDKPCTRCGKAQVIPPAKADLKRVITLVRCEFCGKCSRYNIVDHADKSQSYTLSKWGRGGGDLVRVARWIRREDARLSSAVIRLALDNYKRRAV
jgi:uncharacterized Zn finger protein